MARIDTRKPQFDTPMANTTGFTHLKLRCEVIESGSKTVKAN
jgi:hypothetical protein